MKSTLGAPSRVRSGSGHAGLDSSVVRPIRPGNAVPGLYSSSDMVGCLLRHGGTSSSPSVRFIDAAREPPGTTLPADLPTICSRRALATLIGMTDSVPIERVVERLMRADSTGSAEHLPATRTASTFPRG